MRVLALLLLALSLPLAGVRAGAVPTAPTITLSPATGGRAVTHQVVVAHLAPDQSATLVLFAPDGNQTVYGEQADGNGVITLTLSPSPTWEDGVYRVVAALGGGAAMSALFVANDGTPHLYAGPASPGSWSAFAFVGTGLPPDTTATVHLVPTGGILPPRDFSVTTDGEGIFTLYVWPQEIGARFYEAGTYAVSLPAFALSTDFVTREHPGSPAITLPPAVPADTAVPVTFTDYAADRYIWGVYAGPNGSEAGEFLVGPTDAGGRTDASLTFPYLGTGTSYLATPYDWGETTFTVLAPPPTATATATPTMTPTATPATAHRCASKHHSSRKKHRRHKKRGRHKKHNGHKKHKRREKRSRRKSRHGTCR